jgi:hypothetical protein
VEPVLSESEFGRWLTERQRHIPDGDHDSVGERVAAYDAALLDEFFAALPERIRFWANVRDRETVGGSEIASYIERLEWIALLETEPTFRRFDGHKRFHAVAIALRYGVQSAMWYLAGSAQQWGDDELQDAFDASRELEFLIYQQRGSDVKFVSTRDPAPVTQDPDT